MYKDNQKTTEKPRKVGEENIRPGADMELH